jgi:hypothetical protein
VRSGQRSVVFGLGNGQLELRYMPANADVQVGDILVTSGLDGVYLPGFPVAKVVNIERDSAYSFARIFCVPVAGVENFGEVMVLNPRQPLPEAPPESVGRGSDGGEKNGQRPKKKRRRKETDATDLFFLAHPAASSTLVHFFQPDHGCSAQFSADRPLARHAGLGGAGAVLLERSRIPSRRHGLGLYAGPADGCCRRIGARPTLFCLCAAGLCSAALSRRFLWFPLAQQALQVMPLLLATQVVQVLMRMAVGAEFPGWGFFISPFVATLLWIPATFILLLPQYRPEEQDPDRPI